MKIPEDTDLVMDPKTREMRLTWRGLLRFWLYGLDWRKPELRILPPRGFWIVEPLTRSALWRFVARWGVYLLLYLVIYAALNVVVFGARALLGLWS